MEQSKRNPYFRLLEFVRPYWAGFLAASLAMGAVSGLTAAQALVVKPVVDGIFIQRELAVLFNLALMVIGIFFFKGFFTYLQAYWMGGIGQRIVNELRDRLYSKTQFLPVSYLDDTSSGVLISRITYDVQITQSALTSAITGLVLDCLTIVGLVIIVFLRSPILAATAVIVFPVVVFPILGFGRRVKRLSGEGQVRMGRINTLMVESFAGSRIVKAFGMEEYESARFREENRKFLDLMIKAIKIRALSSPLMEFFGALGAAAIIVVGGKMVISGTMTPGDFASFMTAVFLLYQPIKRLNNANQAIQEGAAAAERIFALLDTPGEEVKTGRELQGPIEEIQFRDVSFRYRDEWVMTGINLKIRKGEAVAFAGASGVGKTTLMNLLLHYYEPTQGAILIDGVDYREYSRESLRGRIALVSQQTVLFNDTLRANIAYGKPEKGRAEIEAAARAAYAHDFIMAFSEGYDTVVGERGVKLSGGQAQRISIARALLKDAPILILDEATSSLDSESEAIVQKALENLMQGRTTLIVAHRFSTIRKVDRIQVLAEGRIVEEGTHADLLKMKGEYARLYEASREEEEKDKKDKVNP
ncbi:MAG: ABC transporter transmembrane domain-containing protein [Proteobacteria bacterium]|nr:ABC transporter transmembrane domain-containing protein [Pseudomonadota bacterium]